MPEWEPLWFSEIEPFPCAVLEHRYPAVPNVGDMTQLPAQLATGLVEAPEVLIGGTPCQAFSVAGMREGLQDERGQLALTFVELADEIDKARIDACEPECVIVWENVPGVLNSKDNAFGCFLGALAGEDCELQPAGKRWPNAGCVYGPQRTVAWRVLDAQYFGLAQRRKRVFVVASARSRFDPAKVLFEFKGVRRDSAPSREQGQKTTGDAGTGVKTASHWDGLEHPHPTLSQSHNTGGIGSSNQELFSQRGSGIVATPYRMVAFGEYADDDSASTMKARDYKDATDLVCVHGTQDPIVSTEHAHALGRNHGQENAVLVDPKSYGIPGNWIGRKPENGGNAVEPMRDIAPCLTSTDRHGVAAFSFDSLASNSMKSSNPSSGCREVNLSKTLDTTTLCPSKNQGGIGILSAQLRVRRLTPVECERLMGFPDGYTQIPWRNKPAEDCPDGHRYKALGNSIAVPNMRWLCQRISFILSR